MIRSARAVVYEGGLRVVERPAPQAGQGEALIRLRLAGICNTDLELMRGYKDFAGTLGHEFVGEVIDGPDEWLGQRVVGEINVSCGECDMCRRGCARTAGTARYSAWRSMTARFQTSSAACGESVGRARRRAGRCGGFHGATCRSVRGAGSECHHAGVPRGDRWRGKLGLLVAQAVRLTGADLTVVARRERRARCSTSGASRWQMRQTLHRALRTW